MADLGNARLPRSLEHYFVLVVSVVGLLGFGYLYWAEERSRVKVWVPDRDLPPYVQIQDADLKERVFAARSLPSDVVKEVNEIRDRYTLVIAGKGKPLSKKKLGPKLSAEQSKVFRDSLLVAIPATYALTLGGSVNAGDLVDITLVPAVTGHTRRTSTIVFPNVLVLDIKPEPTTKLSSAASWVLVIALPSEHQRAYATFSRSASFVIAKRPQTSGASSRSIGVTH